MNLEMDIRSYIEKLGSGFIRDLGWRDMWAFIFQRNSKEKKVFAESHQKSPNFDIWAKEVMIRTSVKREQGVARECGWENSDSGIRRTEFCEKIEGYGRVCHCEYSIKVQVNYKKKCLKHGMNQSGERVPLRTERCELLVVGSPSLGACNYPLFLSRRFHRPIYF